MKVQCLIAFILLVLSNLSVQMVVIPHHFLPHPMPMPTRDPFLMQLLDTDDVSSSNWDIDDVLQYEDIDTRFFDKDLTAAFERYRLHTYGRLWIDAASICWREGGRLAAPVDAAEARTMGRLVDVLALANVSNTEMRDFMHIGVHNLEKKSYLSTTEGDRVIYTPWQEGVESQKTEETCGVILANGRFMQQPCTQTLAFACDTSPSPHETVSTASENEMSGGEGFKFMSDGRPYRLHLQPLPWLEAAKTCQVEGGRLAVPQSERQAGLLAGLVFSCGHLLPQVHDQGLFIGINDIALEGRWHSLDGSEFDGKLWKDANKSRNRSANCGAILSTGQCIDVSCREPKPYICELTHVLKDNPHYIEVEGIGRYAVHVVGKHWLSAAAQCRSENASLAVPNSKEEAKTLDKMQKEVRKSFPGFDSSQVFVGLHDIDRAGIWRTLDGQRLSETGYSEWYGMNGDLMKNNAVCLGLRDAKLITLLCAEEHMFICEKPLEPTNRNVMTEENTYLESNIW